MDMLDKGMIHIPSEITQDRQGILVFIRIVHNLKLRKMVCFCNFPSNIFGSQLTKNKTFNGRCEGIGLAGEGYVP